jgi:hypothetical protein
MLIVALIMAVIGLAALVTAVVTSNEVIAWVCIGASVIGVVLLIVDALRERQRADAESDAGGASSAKADEAEAPETQSTAHEFDAEYPEEPAEEATAGGAAADAEEEPSTEAAAEESGHTGSRSG